MSNIALLWVWICVYLNGAGWVLSGLHALNAWGYAAALLAGLGLLAVWRKTSGIRFFDRLPVLRRRFRRPFPLAYLILTGLILVSGVLYAPSNYDALAYRLPRMLHWLAAGQWHWIHTVFPRLNGRACGVEWVLTPLIALTKTDRLLFLTNIISYLLMPGLIYSVFTRLGVRRRTAWHWMWIMPAGYCFLVQAGGLGNDVFGVPLALAAMDFALRAKTSGSARDFFTAILAAAMMTGAKTSNLPLLLPWGIAMLPCWRLVFRWPVRLGVVVVIAAFASFLPMAALNTYYAHDWTGLKSEGTSVVNDPPLRLVSNVFMVAIQNLVPPVFPGYKIWDQAVQNALPPALNHRLQQAFVEPGAAGFKLDSMQTEENAGLGFGVSLLLLASMAAAARQNGWQLFHWQFDSRAAAWLTLLRWLPWISLLALLEQSTIFTIARVLTPYYGLLLPALLAGPAQARLVRQRWWRMLAGVVFILALGLLTVLPARPLFPAQTVFADLAGQAPQNSLVQLAHRTYGIYAQRHNAFAPVLALLPPDVKTLGLFTYDDPEAALWQPFGSRRIEHVCPSDTAADLNQKGIHYVLIPPHKLAGWFHQTAPAWVHSLGGTVVQIIPLDIRVTDGPQDWWLVKLP